MNNGYTSICGSMGIRNILCITYGDIGCFFSTFNHVIVPLSLDLVGAKCRLEESDGYDNIAFSISSIGTGK